MLRQVDIQPCTSLPLLWPLTPFSVPLLQGPSAWRTDPNAGDGTECFCQLQALSGEQSWQTPWEADTGQEKVGSREEGRGCGILETLSQASAPPSVNEGLGPALTVCHGWAQQVRGREVVLSSPEISFVSWSDGRDGGHIRP